MMTESAAALCDKFTKLECKRGKPARDSLCAVCEVVWTNHFNEKDSSRGTQQPVLHPEKVRVIPEPSFKRRPRPVAKAAPVVVAKATRDSQMRPQPVEPHPAEQESVYVEPKPKPIKLINREGQNRCWEWQKQSWMKSKKAARPEMNAQELEMAFQVACDNSFQVAL
jgi:hypothetical protein